MRVMLIVAGCLLASLAGGLVVAQEEQAVITSPTSDDVLFGEVQIVGSARHPEFARFQLEFATASQPDDWLSIQQPVGQQVTDGILGVWDTTDLPDGAYRLRLRVFLRDGAYFETVVDGIQVNNTQPTPIPTALPQPTVPLTTPTPTAGPSPTPIIWQPPSVTPRAAAGSGAAPERPGGSAGDWLTAANLQSAVCTGAYVTLAFFALLAFYLGVRPALRPWIRRVWRSIRRGLR